MPLRTQIMLLVAGAVILTGLGVSAIGMLRHRADVGRLSNIAIALQRSLWTNLVDEEADDLNLVAAELVVRLSQHAPNLDRDAVAEVIETSPDVVTDDINVQVVGLDGAPISANAPLFRSRPLIDQPILRRLMAGESSIGGLRQESPDRFVVASVRPVTVQGEVRAAISVSRNAGALIDQLSRDIGERVYLLSPRGRLVAGSDPALWNAAQLAIPRRAERARFIDVGEASYFAAPVTVEGITDRTAGILVTLRDVTQSRVESKAVERWSLAAVIAGVIIIIVTLYGLLRSAFLPLEDAVAALDALSKGDLSRPIADGGSGEIGRIAEAVAVFRRNAQQLIDQEEGIARQRRRQERVIRRELERLAGLLDPEGRAEILTDLADVLPADRALSGPNAELATLAHLLERMSHRIADQHRRLNELIAELKDAIVTRARLAALEQELDIARELQRTFLPKPLPPDPRFEVFGLMESAKEVGGDFFDIFMIDAGRLGIVVADVSGKGVPAALFMAITRTLIKATALTAAGPAETVSKVNAFLAADNEQMMFVTLFHGVLEIDSRCFTYVNAGHNPPYLITAAGPESLARIGGPALAVVEEMDYAQATITLEPSAALFAFTDGVTEAFNPLGEAYGETRLEAVLEREGTLPVEPLCRTVRQSVLDFEDGADQADDVTCFALRVNP